MGQDHRVPTTQLDLINRRLERLAEQHRKFRSAARSPTVPIYDADFPLDAVDGQWALRHTADPPAELAHTAGFYYHGDSWFLATPGPFVYAGTDGVDGVDAKLAANPHPYATGDGTGPPPFLNGMSNAFLSADGYTGDGLRARPVPHGIQIDCGGGISGVADETAIVQWPWGPDTLKIRVAANVDGGAFVYRITPSGLMTYMHEV